MKLTKKFFKNTEIRNAALVKDFYTETEIEELEKAGIVFYIGDSKDYPRVWLVTIDKIEVEYNSEYDCLAAAAYVSELWREHEGKTFEKVYVEIA